jgi:glycerol-3-phosphate dehydrogenase
MPIPSREAAIGALTAKPLDVLVIGGGIVGAGVARDAAMRGLRTAVIDQRDFASGTSSRSSRLLHGGIRYLAQGRVGLVREASLEKTILRQIAPHLCEPLPFVFPARRGTPWKRWQLSIGVKLYDLLCSGRNLGRSRTLSASETLARIPGLSAESLTGAVEYYDALTNDSRLVLDTLRSAAAHGAICINYLRLIEANPDGVRWQGCLEDVETGCQLLAVAHCVVNAAGSWSDRFPHSSVHLRLTKGVHLVIDRTRLPVPAAVVIAEGDRILFAIPWGERIILGTTDTDYAGQLDEPPCDLSDALYVLAAANDAFPKARLEISDVLSVWSGLRPLLADPHGGPSDISRRHVVASPCPGWWDVAGGKLTTYRLMAEETCDQIVRFLDRRHDNCTTGTIPLIAANGTAHAADASGILPPPLSQELVTHYCQNEWARTLADVMLRRTSWRHYCRNHAEIAEQVAAHMAASLDWTPAEIAKQLRAYQELTTWPGD